MSRLARIAMLMVVWSSVAEAHPKDDGDERRGTDAHVGMALGVMGVDRYSAGLLLLTGGVSAGDGPTRAAAQVEVGEQLGKVGDERERGVTGAVALQVQRELGGVRDGRARLATWLTGGLAYRAFEVDDHIVARPEASIGVGVGFIVSSVRRRVGYSIELRLLAAPGVKWNGSAARCSGDCAMHAPAMDRVDLGALFSLTFPFAKQ